MSKSKTTKPVPPKRSKPATGKPAASATATDVTAEKPAKRKRNNNTVDPKARSGTIAPVVPDKEETPEFISRALELGLTHRDIEFVQIYLTSYNQTRSYMAAYNCNTYAAASVEATKKMADPKIRQYLYERMEAAFKRTEVAQQELIQLYTYLAFGDVNELVEYRRESCRFCHGEGHRYQFTPAEREDAYKAFMAEQAAPKKGKAGGEPEGGAAPAVFDELGGVGFNPRLPPHPDCPECHGEGRGRVHIHDTRNLSPAALALYEGAEITKDGIKIKTSSRDGAREKLAKILKLYEDTAQVNLTIASTEELDQIYERAMETMKAKRDEVKNRSLTDDED